MAVAKSVTVVREQPRLHIEHRVMVAATDGPVSGYASVLEKLLNEFYLENGPAWELVNMFKVEPSDFLTPHRELMFIFQRRTYQAASD